MDLKLFKINEGEKPLDNIKENCGLCAILKDVGVIGDSLSSGEFESTDENGNILYHDFYEYSWPSFLSHITGGKYYNYSRGGMSLKEFYESWADKNKFWQKRQVYIISLGNNDLFLYNQKPGSHLDIDINNPNNNPDTYFGYLGKVISKLKSIQKDARIFIVSLQIDRIDSKRDEIALYVEKELEQVVKMYSCTYLIDITKYMIPYDEKVREKFALGFHPNACGYYAFALVIGNYIDYIIRNNYKDFITLPFVGRGIENKNYDK